MSVYGSTIGGMGLLFNFRALLSLSLVIKPRRLEQMEPSMTQEQNISREQNDIELHTLTSYSRSLQACGPIKSFKRLITPANKPQGFGFAEFEDPEGALLAIELLNGVELPALEDGCANKKLLVRLKSSFCLASNLRRSPPSL